MKHAREDLFTKLETLGIDTTHIVGNVTAHGNGRGALLTWDCQMMLNAEQVAHLFGFDIDTT